MLKLGIMPFIMILKDKNMRIIKKLGLPLIFKIFGSFSFAPAEENCWFERFWRPMFGYCVSFAWLCQMLTICLVVWNGNPQAPEIINALVDTASLWGVAMGVLGVSVVKGTPVTTRNRDEDVKQNRQTNI